ncbi:UDP-N-acetylmuramoyl-tripeptide--D-alanyl-D-alanine ligase [Polluticoccus soli]|uniref:UDP-N-acetylmuramoyl-tripeptide--D-alanyl-D- alanine ligase n=1 Tax=Polluticoccus soli TaxID=3034150 RepID=UPI0023E1E4B0|nr:UDP-N-acetylmuramoyl-tripeptide--D-alanyl-D-alanine ligase [Flavipsychrobacter sp. JY13-12]
MIIQELYNIYLAHLSVQTDTRKLRQGDIFFALKGPNFNGNTYAKQALEQGAAYAVIDDSAYAESDKYIVVDDVLTALQRLAKHHRQQFDIPFIAITGSNGKTTTKELVTTVLKQKFVTYATEGNLNNHIGVPLTLLKIGKDAQMAVIEMGANHQKEIASYCQIALPTHGIITNCGKAHIEGFGGIEGVRKGKGELYDFLRENGGSIFRNTDLDYLKDMANGIADQVTYGSANAQYIGKPIMDDVFLKVAVLSTGAETTLNTQLVGDYNFPNVMVATAVGLHFGIGIDSIKEAIANYSPDNSRSQWLQKGSNKVILDAYNANPTSMRAAIQNFAAAHLTDKMLWLGGMKEMGPDEQKEHKELVDFINQYQWKNVLLVGKEFNGLNGDYQRFDTSAEAAEFVKANQPNDAAILIKGSRGSKMEVLLEALPA